MNKQIYTYFNADQTLHEKDFDLFYISNIHNVSTEKLSHEFYEFSFFLSGRVTIFIEQTEYSLLPGHVLLIPPGTIHRMQIDQTVPFAIFIITVSKSYFQGLLQRTDDYGYILKQVLHTKNYLYLLDEVAFGLLQNRLFHLLEEQRTERFGKAEQVTVCINELLLTLNRIVYELAHPNTDDMEYTLAHELALYIEQHLSEDLTLDLLAKNFFVSKYHISHTFKNTFGVTLHQYLTKKRLELVRTDLLKNEDISNKFMNYGFKDYSGLFRAFKKEYGLSPKEYQKQYSIRKNQVKMSK